VGGEGGGEAGYTRPASLLSRVGGRGQGGGGASNRPCSTTEMHVDLSFSYLRFAEAASFDKKSSAGAAHTFILFKRVLHIQNHSEIAVMSVYA
jgi:hypothetical protein